MIVRDVEHRDCGELCLVLNQIITIGGTTAFELELDEDEFKSYFLNGSACINSFLVEHDNMLMGFQSLSHHSKLPEGWGDIATFSRVEPRVRGVGTKLFDATKDYAQRNKIEFINATIRADNKAGLAYYEKMGFVDYSVTRNIPLLDGSGVDRISKKYKVR